jgi:hypothetical protein
VDFNIMTPIGKGTIVGMSPDHKKILVMHTREEKKGTYAKWWPWDDRIGAIDETKKEEE